MSSRSRDILKQIIQLKNALDGFSFDELTISEAKALKQSFETFRVNLEDSVWGNPIESIKAQLQVFGDSEKKSESKFRSLIPSKEGQSPLCQIQDFITNLLTTDLSEKDESQLIEIHNLINSNNNPKAQTFSSDADYLGPEVSLDTEKGTFKPRQIVDQVKYICQTLITSEQLALHFHIDRNLPETLAGVGGQFYDLLMKLLSSRISELNVGQLVVKIYPKYSKNKLFINIELLEQNLEFSASKNTGGREAATVSLIELSQLIEKHGGKFWLGNAFGNQSSIHLQIPARTGVKLNRTLPLSEKVIIVLNNNSYLVGSIINNLEQYGATVLTQNNTLRTLQMVHEQKVDMIIIPTDIDGVDAFQACMRIRNSASDTVRKVPVIALDNLNNDGHRNSLKRVGVDHILSSNISSDELLSSLSLIMLEASGKDSRKISQEAFKTSDFERCWETLMDEANGNTIRFEERIWMYRSDLITLLGALKVHLTLLDYDQIELNCDKLDAILEQFQAHTWTMYLEEFRRLNKAKTGVNRMRDVYRLMLEEYQKWDHSLEQFLLKIKNNPRG